MLVGRLITLFDAMTNAMLPAQTQITLNHESILLAKSTNAVDDLFLFHAYDLDDLTVFVDVALLVLKIWSLVVRNDTFDDRDTFAIFRSEIKRLLLGTAFLWLWIESVWIEIKRLTVRRNLKTNNLSSR